MDPVESSPASSSPRVVEDVFQERLRVLLREQGVSLPGRQDLEDPH
jgi:hypothetical protein